MKALGSSAHWRVAQHPFSLLVSRLRHSIRIFLKKLEHSVEFEWNFIVKTLWSKVLNGEIVALISLGRSQREQQQGQVPLESIWAPPVQPESCDSVATNAVDATVPGAKLLSGSGSAAHFAAARPTPKMPLFPPHFDTTRVSNWGAAHFQSIVRSNHGH